MLLWRIVPSNVVEIMADCSVAEFWSAADDSMKITFRRGDEICVVHKDSSWEIIPSPYTVLKEGPG